MKHSQRYGWLLFARFAQLIGNLLKGFFVIHHRCFPHQRFTIPHQSKAWLKSKDTKNIPRIFWQTNYTDKVTLPVYVNYLWNRLLTPTFDYRYALDADCEAFIQNNFPPDVYQSYQALTIGASKADFWRVLVVLKHGGIYLDMDAGFCSPPEFFLRNTQEELFIKNKEGSITNYFFAASPNHPTVAAIATHIQQNIDTNAHASIYDLTGPTVFDTVLKKWGKAFIDASPSYVRQGLLTRKEFQYPNNLSGYWVTEEQKNKTP